jgi:hypothetical protein
VHCTALQDVKEKTSKFELKPITCEVDKNKIKKLVLNPPKKKVNIPLSAEPSSRVPAEGEHFDQSRYIHSASCPFSTCLISLRHN